MALQFDPLQNDFTIYEPIEPKKVELKLPTYKTPFDISDWAVGVTEEGVPVSKNSLWNRNKETPIQEIRKDTPHQDIIPTVTPTISNNKVSPDYVYNFFINKGLSREAAAGITGNLMHESQLDPTNNTGDNGSAFGLAQWRGSRWEMLKQFAQNRQKDISDVDTQLEFVWYELNNGYKKALNALRRVIDVDEATNAFMLLYENPNIEKANLAARKKYAKSVYK